MNASFSHFCRITCCVLSLAATAASARAPVVPGEPAAAPKAAPAPRLHLREPAPPVLRVVAAPITEAEIARVRALNVDAKPRANTRRLAIGVERASANLPALPAARDLAWRATDGGQAARMALTTPQAAAVRVALDLAGAPGDLEMVFFGSADPARLVGPIRVADIADRTTPWWSPLTAGDTQTVEFFWSGAGDASRLGLRATGVSHLFTGPDSAFRKDTRDIGRAGACNVDIACSPLASSSAFRDAASAVAEMVFMDAGVTIECSGTLLNDTDTTTQVPWFFSANHCFDNDSPPYKTASQMQTVANTLNTLWFFEASACNSGTVSASYRQLSSGARYLYSDLTSDVLFLRLNGEPPQGAFYAGWDANALAAGSPVLTIHHPQGDLKKVSQGTMTGFSTPGVGGGSNTFLRISWSSGTTEAGSSGAGLFTASGSGYALRGALWGGTALCTNTTGTDSFSRFDQAYPALAAYLNAAPAPATDYTDLWWNPNESGWGLNLVQHPSRNIFGVWYTYEADGTRTWFVLPGGTWTATNTFTGTLYATSGPPYTAPFDPARLRATVVGTGTLDFTDANHGMWTYTVNGVSGAKAIERQPY